MRDSVSQVDPELAPEERWRGSPQRRRSGAAVMIRGATAACPLCYLLLLRGLGFVAAYHRESLVPASVLMALIGYAGPRRWSRGRLDRATRATVAQCYDSA